MLGAALGSICDTGVGGIAIVHLGESSWSRRLRTSLPAQSPPPPLHINSWLPASFSAPPLTTTAPSLPLRFSQSARPATVSAVRSPSLCFVFGTDPHSLIAFPASHAG